MPNINRPANLSIMGENSCARGHFYRCTCTTARFYLCIGCFYPFHHMQTISVYGLKQQVFILLHDKAQAIQCQFLKVTQHANYLVNKSLFKNDKVWKRMMAQRKVCVHYSPRCIARKGIQTRGCQKCKKVIIAIISNPPNNEQYMEPKE